MGASSKSASPLPYPSEVEGKRGGGEGKGEAESSPFLSPFPSFLLLLFGLYGAHQPTRGWSVPCLAH